MRTKRLKRRFALILALGTAGALALTGIALGAANSTVTVNFNPAALPTSTFQGGKLFVHTHSTYGAGNSGAGNNQPQGSTNRAQLWFDDDFQVNTGAAPKCPTASVTGATITMQQAMAACSSSLVGSGTAQAVTNGGGYTIPGCVLVFNGQDATGEVLLFTRVHAFDPPPNNTINCSSPATNTAGDLTILLKGDLKAAGTVPGTGVADFTDPDNCSAPVRTGCQLDVNNINAAAAFPLTDFNVGIQKGTFVAARCHDTGEPSASRLDLRVKFSYKTGTATQTKNAAADCT